MSWHRVERSSIDVVGLELSREVESQGTGSEDGESVAECALAEVDVGEECLAEDLTGVGFSGDSTEDCVGDDVAGSVGVIAYVAGGHFASDEVFDADDGLAAEFECCAGYDGGVGADEWSLFDADAGELGVAGVEKGEEVVVVARDEDGAGGGVVVVGGDLLCPDGGFGESVGDDFFVLAVEVVVDVSFTAEQGAEGDEAFALVVGVEDDAESTVGEDLGFDESGGGAEE